MVTKLIHFFGRAAKAVCLSLLAIVLLNGMVVPGAIAMPNDAADIAMSRAADELDRVVGEGTSDQIEGKVQRDIGTVERSVGKVTGQVEGATKQVEGAAKQVEGKLKSDIGRTQAATEEARDTVENAAEGFIDLVKELFD